MKLCWFRLWNRAPPNCFRCLMPCGASLWELFSSEFLNSFMTVASGGKCLVECLSLYYGRRTPSISFGRRRSFVRLYSGLRYVAVTAKKAKLVRSFNCFIARAVERLHPYRKGHVFLSLWRLNFSGPTCNFVSCLITAMISFSSILYPTVNLNLILTL